MPRVSLALQNIPLPGAVCGVDFSGAKLAGRTTWVARLEPSAGVGPPFTLTALRPIENLCGSAERGPTLEYLSRTVASSEGCLWGLGFPFGFPLEVAGPWGEQLELVGSWGDDAYGLGLELVRRTEELCGRKHLRRLTDLEYRVPHDPYHYRVIYQTFFGMRDVLALLLRTPGTAVLPFRYRCLPTASRVVVEVCPATTLDRLGLPRRNYKRPQGGALTFKEKGVRREILRGLRAHVALSEHRRRVTARDPGGDALDAVLAALGAALAFRGGGPRGHRCPPPLPARGQAFRLTGHGGQVWPLTAVLREVCVWREVGRTLGVRSLSPADLPVHG